jgi:hypothetical protein
MNYETKKCQFLSLAKVKPSNETNFVLIQHPKDKNPICYRGVLKDCSDIYVHHEGIERPQVHGSLILNENSEVIGIGNSCGLSGQIGNIITEDIVGKMLQGAFYKKKYSSSVFMEKVNDKREINSAAALCKITIKGTTFTGFLCRVPAKGNKPLNGLFTTYLDINWKQSFRIHFDKDNVDITVEPNDIFYTFTDQTLEFAFIAFKEPSIDKLRGKMFLSVSPNEASIFSEIFLLHHPKGKNASLSRGVVIGYDDNYLQHISHTEFGSAGAPILNGSHQVIGIHNGTGPLDENSKPLYKIGTKMDEIVKKISYQRFNITV